MISELGIVQKSLIRTDVYLSILNIRFYPSKELASTEIVTVKNKTLFKTPG
jgi:hypothetical protein